MESELFLRENFTSQKKRNPSQQNMFLYLFLLLFLFWFLFLFLFLYLFLFLSPFRYLFLSPFLLLFLFMILFLLLYLFLFLFLCLYLLRICSGICKLNSFSYSRALGILSRFLGGQGKRQWTTFFKAIKKKCAENHWILAHWIGYSFRAESIYIRLTSLRKKMLKV